MKCPLILSKTPLRWNFSLLYILANFSACNKKMQHRHRGKRWRYIQCMYSCTSIHMSTDLELNTMALVAICGHIPLVGRTKHPKTVDRFCKNPTKQFKKVPLTTALSLMTYDCFTLSSLFTGRNKGRRGIHTQRSCWKLSGHQVSLMILTPHLPSAMNLVVVRCTCIAKLNDFNRLCRALINV